MTEQCINGNPPPCPHIQLVEQRLEGIEDNQKKILAIVSATGIVMNVAKWSIATILAIIVSYQAYTDIK